MHTSFHGTLCTIGLGNYNSTSQCGSYCTEHEEKIFIWKMKQFDDGGDTKTVNLNEEPEVSSCLDIRLSEQAEQEKTREDSVLQNVVSTWTNPLDC